MIRGWKFKSLSEYGMLVVLLLLCAYYSWATMSHGQAVGPDAGRECAQQVLARSSTVKDVAIVVGQATDNAGFAEAATAKLRSSGVTGITTIEGDPHDIRQGLMKLTSGGQLPAVFLTTADARPTVVSIQKNLPGIASLPVVSPSQQNWPEFLGYGNVVNVANQISVIAIMAVGMTMVIITGGIDLSVGSLVAFSAILTAVLLRDYAGGKQAHTGGILLCCLAAVLACGLFGLVTGLLKNTFDVPPFIVTLSVMLIASGVAYKLSKGQSIYDVPSSIGWLGLGTGIGGMPHAVMLMLVLYLIAHVVMTRTRLGRYIYAVGGNPEAARLSGVGVKRVLLVVYVVSGLTAGIGGVIEISKLGGAAPTYGLGYELSVIAAVVVGGTSLSGGSGNIIGTLIGALIISVMQNGMNLTGVDSYDQKVVLGVVILAAVLLDNLKQKNWNRPKWMRRTVLSPSPIGATLPVGTLSPVEQSIRS